MSIKELEKIYDPQSLESAMYANWSQSGYFKAAPNPEKEPFCIVIPPPNITGQLHMGHALNGTMQDIIIRFKRMQGYETLWQPGTDHASIATEAKVVEYLAQQGLSKDGLGREAFLEKCWEWKEKYANRIIEQFKTLGCSCDWSRTRFTLDEGCNNTVNHIFEYLYKKGLIYRGERMINWCPHCMTSLSDAEVEHEEHDGSFYHLLYPLSDGSGHLKLATTRPETMFGDTAVAVHPDDERYAGLVGKTVKLPLTGREIPIIADSFVDMEFGTGVVKITPAHDPNDFEAGLRNSLPQLKVMDYNAVMNENAGEYCGLDRFEARKKVVAELTKQGLLEKIEPIKHNVGQCYRCDTVVEPMISLQWFVKMKPLAEPTIDSVKRGEMEFVPKRFEKIFFHWMENIRDWCISRQLWWGHRIPAYYCDCGETTVSAEHIEKCPACGGSVTQDPDTLDTWFSSALWPMSTLGWLEGDPYFDYFYPTNVLVTASDIIFFWVARMMFSGLEYTGKQPFSQTLFNGIVRDAQGKKMSKSSGNGVDPVDMIEKYGADSLRFSLINGTGPGVDMRISEEKIESSRNFCNKLWNAARFILLNLEDDFLPGSLPSDLALEDKWILTRYNDTVREVTAMMEKYELGMAVGKLYDFIWDEFCDWFIELSKDRLYAGGEAKSSAAKVLCFVMSGTLQMLHPFMPFITEEIWQKLPHSGESIMISDWPKPDAGLDFGSDARNAELIMQSVKAIRNRRAEMGVPPSKKARLFVDSAAASLYTDCARFFLRLAGCSEVIEGSSEGVAIITENARLTIPMNELVDIEGEKKRLFGEISAIEKDIASIDAKLSNENFVGKAPAAIVDEQRDRREKLLSKLSIAKEALTLLG